MLPATPAATADDAALVAQYLEHRTEAAFCALYRAHTPYLWGLALRLCAGDRAQAEEHVQEAWTRAAERLATFGGQSSLRTWLAGIVVNCVREGRRHARRTLPDDHAAVALAAPASRSGPQAVDLERALAALPDGQRDVVVLHLVAGYSHEEVGALLGIPAGTSKSRLAVARRTLRRHLSAMAPKAPSPGASP